MASDIAPDMFTLFSRPGLAYSSHCDKTLKRSDPNFLGLSIPDLRRIDGGYPYTLDIDNCEQATLAAQQGRNAQPASYDTMGQGENTRQMPTPLYFAPPTMYQTQPVFTATNVHSTKRIEPNKTRFDSSFDSSQSSSGDGTVHSATSSTSGPWSDVHDSVEPSPKRRRKSEFAEPGSARAVYLEKNRKAAGKCRGKQKQQQEKLVETARDIERHNRGLKAEVELLKGDMRDLMELVGIHANCPDTRLRTYIQREADRLVAGDRESGVAGRVSSENSPLRESV